MKKIVFGGFCMISGLLLFGLTAAMPASFFVNMSLFPLARMLSVLLFVVGFVLGVIGLKEK
jgi:hypothetical protein